MKAASGTGSSFSRTGRQERGWREHAQLARGDDLLHDNRRLFLNAHFAEVVLDAGAARGQRNAKDRVEVVRNGELLKDQRIDVGLRIDGEAAGRARGVEEVDVRAGLDLANGV